MVDGWAGTRAEREWLQTLQGIPEALDAIADELKRHNDREEEKDEHRDR